MASLTNEILGKPHGGIATLMFKTRRGKTYIATRPENPNSSNHPNILFKKNQGRFIGKLSQAIYHNTLIKQIWFQSEYDKQYLYQQIWKKNFLSIKYNDLSGNVVLIPSVGFKLQDQLIEQFKIDSGRITASPFENNAEINPEIEKSITAFGIMVYINNPDSLSAETNFGILTADTQIIDLSNPVDIGFKINLNGLPPVQNNAVRKLFVTLITLDKSGSPVRYFEQISCG